MKYEYKVICGVVISVIIMVVIWQSRSSFISKDNNAVTTAKPTEETIESTEEPIENTEEPTEEPVGGTEEPAETVMPYTEYDDNGDIIESDEGIEGSYEYNDDLEEYSDADLGISGFEMTEGDEEAGTENGDVPVD